MIFKWLKNRAIQNKTAAYLKARESGEQRESVQKLQKLAILIDASNEINILSLVRVADELGVKSSDLKVVAYKEDFNESDGNFGEANYFNEKGIGNNGAFTSGFLQDFLARDYDVLINFYKPDHLIINYVALASKAKFKVGFAETDHRINDLIISGAADKPDTFITELKKYLKILQII